jgi:polysaccharide export outer membrane protein
MNILRLNRRHLAACIALLACVQTFGCFHIIPVTQPVDAAVPRELSKVILPEYVIEPPDILLIDAVRVVPKPPYKIEPLDTLLINVPNAFEKEPILGLYGVDSDGSVNLGFSYGTVNVVGLTISEAKNAIEKHLKAAIKEPQVVVSQGQSRAVEQIRGDHLVRQDGTISLGIYGSVQVVGMTINTAKAAIENHLSAYLQKPEVSVDVSAFNSKVYYVIFDGGGNGQQIVRLPTMGNETVLDAIATVNGISPVSSKHRVFISRPSPGDVNGRQILPVDWEEVTMGGLTGTNYQLLPGDRVYVQADPWITFDTRVARVLNLFTLILGFTLLGNGTIRAVDGQKFPLAGVGF